MEWSRLLSVSRIGRERRPAEKGDLRSEFEKDYHRIIVSASFRRLQDKTQVFPLDKSDFIRTRLTHSLEVSSIGRSLAGNIGSAIRSEGLDPDFTPEMQRDLVLILACAGLIHDIGNPPFGHFGEEAIREWFVKRLPELKALPDAEEGGDGSEAAPVPVRELLTEQQYRDLLHFEGNAQGLRMVSRLDYPVEGMGMNLTCGLLSAMIKYPTSSLAITPGAKEAARRKMGYFASEEAVFRQIQEETGTRGARNPLALILEAADDIAYATADIEDAFKKGFFSYGTLTAELLERGVKREWRKVLSDQYDLARLSGVMGPEEYAIRSWLRQMQDELILAATEGFLSHYRAIMQGSYGGELVTGKAPLLLLRALKGIAYDYAFTSASIFKTEIAANNVLTYLLDVLVPSALVYDTGRAPGLMEEKYLSLIPENYRQVYHREVRGRRERVYERILLATDTVSGMTDSYARDLYTELTGFRA